MKVLSLTEPFATLIKEGKKKIETRSWQTNYRGELYIHASMTKPAKSDLEDQELMSLIKNVPLNQGYIICKCNLVDCIYMTEEFVNDMKKNHCQEYICGEYSVGRYAWILEDVQVIIDKISTKGHLGIWNYYNEFEIMNLMEKIHYGWIDSNKKSHQIVDNTYSEKYRLQSPTELIKNKLGVCWDQVELERYYFQKTNFLFETYFIVYYDGDKCPTHTFLIFHKNDHYYWFEHSYEKFRGIHEYSSKKELLLDVKNKFVHDGLEENYNSDNLMLFEYQLPKYHLTVAEFYKHCENGKTIDI